MKSSPLPDGHWAATLPPELIPAAISTLAALTAVLAARMMERGSGDTEAPSGLIDAPTLAARLGVAESNIRAAARAGRIPCVRIGRYYRFDALAVARALGGADA